MRGRGFLSYGRFDGGFESTSRTRICGIGTLFSWKFSVASSGCTEIFVHTEVRLDVESVVAPRMQVWENDEDGFANAPKDRDYQGRNPEVQKSSSR